MKKLSVFLGGIVFVLLVGIYLVGGLFGAACWTLAILVIGPLASLCLVLEIIFLIKKVFEKKSIRRQLLLIGLTGLLAYPLTILMGLSPINYPINSNLEGLEMKLPVEKSIALGGPKYKTHAIWPSECYAYDLVCEPYDSGAERLSEYGIYLKDVLAPCSGKIIKVKNDEVDIAPNTDQFISALGNYVFIELDQKKGYVILAHLAKESIEVKEGQQIKTGEYIGKVGNSGTSSEPHLHIQLQRNNPTEMIYPTIAEGLPIEWQE